MRQLRDDEYTIVDADELEVVETGVRPPISIAPSRGRHSTPPPPPRHTRTSQVHALALSITARTTASSTEDFKLADLQAELTRLRRQMRARDAYLAELERALSDYDALLAHAGLHGLDDLAGLLGRVRGQAYRIAELESELRNRVAPPLAPTNRTAFADKPAYTTRTKSNWNKPAAVAAGGVSRTSRVSARAHAK